jgi:putative restriction endonuclease
MEKHNWTREELIVAFNLYCKTPFGKIHIHNPEIISLAKILDRSPSAVSWKLANFARLDPTLQKRDISGATHGGKLEIQVWNEFNANWERLAFESEKLLAKLSGTDLTQGIQSVEPVGEGKEREAVVRVRVNQSFFRAAVLADYDYKCCITSLDIIELLNASHIVPWSVDTKNRVNPRNGLCLNAIHDRAFDRGLITITPDYQVVVSAKVKSKSPNNALKTMLLDFEGIRITLPDKFVPDPAFLEYHNTKVFIE